MVKRKRITEIQNAALRIVAEYGIEKLDALPLDERAGVLADMQRRLMDETGCVYQTARKRIAWAARRLRDPQTPPVIDRRGGHRPGAGRPGRVERLFRAWAEETGQGEIVIEGGNKIAVFNGKRIPVSALGYTPTRGFFDTREAVDDDGS